MPTPSLARTTPARHPSPAPQANTAIVLARYARNKHAVNACYLWAFTSINFSPGARTFYDQHRTQGDTHNQTVRALANRWVGILHGCLQHHAIYDERTAWATAPTPPLDTNRTWDV